MAHNIDLKKELVRLAKNGVSHEYIGPLILEKIQMYILTRAELLSTLCYEIPCTKKRCFEKNGNCHLQYINFLKSDFVEYVTFAKCF